MEGDFQDLKYTMPVIKNQPENLQANIKPNIKPFQPQPNVFPYATELEIIKSFGYTDEEKFKKILEMYNGDIQHAINAFLG